MGSHTPERARPISYADRALTHPAVLVAVIAGVVVCFLGTLGAGVLCLYLHLDPEPLLRYLGPGAIVAAGLALLNGGGLLALKAALARQERNTGAIAAAVGNPIGDDGQAVVPAPRPPAVDLRGPSAMPAVSVYPPAR